MRIIQEHEKCIGCGTCVALCPKFWEMGEDGKAHSKGGKRDPKTGNHELEIKEVDCNKDTEYSCPVQIIHIIK